MSAAVQSPQAPPFDSDVLDDPDTPGTYVTDGEQLFRLLGGGEPRRGLVCVEDCATLEVVAIESSELRALDLRPVCPRAIAMAP